MKDKIILLDLNYTLVSNQLTTLHLRPLSVRLTAEEYRQDLLDAIADNKVIIITARPDYQGQQSLDNILAKNGWKPDEAYFNDLNLEPPQIKESILQRFVFPKHGTDGNLYYAIESNPATRAMYAKYGIMAAPYETFIQLQPKSLTKQ